MLIKNRVRVTQSSFDRIVDRTTREEVAQQNISEGTTVRSYNGVVKAHDPLLKPSKHLSKLD